MLYEGHCNGRAGFIGSHLVDELIHNGAKIHVLDNLISGHLNYTPACRPPYRGNTK
ncbi:NAD-dependent epimerase/dehydratase family protein [Peribacillus simplex]|uniref:NAD-dependent epimerase/dehydratase family protein n=1 Tax=Peribacillus simplex TaxID=1478 RepID=UPI0039908C92